MQQLDQCLVTMIVPFLDSMSYAQFAAVSRSCNKSSKKLSVSQEKANLLYSSVRSFERSQQKESLRLEIEEAEKKSGNLYLIIPKIIIWIRSRYLKDRQGYIRSDIISRAVSYIMELFVKVFPSVQQNTYFLDSLERNKKNYEGLLAIESENAIRLYSVFLKWRNQEMTKIISHIFDGEDNFATLPILNVKNTIGIKIFDPEAMPGPIARGHLENGFRLFILRFIRKGEPTIKNYGDAMCSIQPNRLQSLVEKKFVFQIFFEGCDKCELSDRTIQGWMNDGNAFSLPYYDSNKSSTDSINSQLLKFLHELIKTRQIDNLVLA